MEGVVIVASILLAFGIEAWWDGVQEREEEAALLHSLRAEIRLNLDRLDESDSDLRRANERADVLLHLAGPDAQSVEAVRFDSLLVEAVSFSTFHPSTGSISAVLGRLSLIRSEALRQEIAGFEERLRDFRENFDFGLDEVGALLLHVQDRAPLFTSDNAAWTQADPGTDGRLILRDVEFANLLGLWVWRMGRMNTESTNFRAHLNRMLNLIEA